MTDRVYTGNERECSVCRKKFIMYPDWAFKQSFKSREKVFCSWSCMRKWEKNRGDATVRRERIKQALRDGLTIAEIVKLLGESPEKVWYWKKQMEKIGEI